MESDEQLFLNKGEMREISFSYSNNGVEASKTLILKGEGYEGRTGFDFDFQVSVKRNGNPVETYSENAMTVFQIIPSLPSNLPDTPLIIDSPIQRTQN